MKLKDGFLLRDIAGQAVVLSTGGDVDLNTMITLNETGKFLWQQLEQERLEEDLVKALLAEYEDADEASAKAHVAAFVQKLKDNDFLA